MPIPRTKTSASDAIVGLWTIALSAAIIAALFYGRDLLIPLALASLLTFLLSPLVTRLQRWLGRVGAVVLIILLLCGLTVSAGWVLTRQVVDLGTRLPDYKENIRTKLKSIQVPAGGGVFTKFSEAVEDLKKDVPSLNKEPAPDPAAGLKQDNPSAARQPVPVEVVEGPDTKPMELVRLILSPVLGPLGTAGLVLLLVIFMLLKREDLRSRLIRLIGQGRISATTQAMEDAADRVMKYLFMQLIVNVTYGIPVAIGLYFIGVPNAILWGTFAAVLRFIPYAGPWIAAAFPIILSLAVSPDWSTPLLTIGLFVALELLSNNVMEPWLYGSSTGVSSFALIVAAVFWTWMWGPVGLVLATPITVCLVVMGRHIPKLSFLSVLLSDQEALTPAEDCYHRLLRAGGHEEMELAEHYLKTHTLTELYDEVLVPVVVAAERDFRLGLLDKEQRDSVEEGLEEILEETGGRMVVAARGKPGKGDEEVAVVRPAARVYCVPSRAKRDSIAGAMLAHLLNRSNFEALNAPGKMVSGELIGLVEMAGVDIVCISVVEPSTISHARYLAMKLRARMPDQKIVVGLWGGRANLPETIKMLGEAGVDEVVTSLAEAETVLHRLAVPLVAQMVPAPVPENDRERVDALRSMGIGGVETGLEPLTAKAARVFEVPNVLVSLIDQDRQIFTAYTGLPEEFVSAGGMDRSISVCGHVVEQDEMMVVEDLAKDRRFANNPTVKDRSLRFYAGAPIHAPNGQPVGVVCLMDIVPRKFTTRERRMLTEYASEVSDDLARIAREKTNAGVAERLEHMGEKFGERD